MESHEKELIELLAPFIRQAPHESKRRDMLYLKLHGGKSRFVTHSTFVKNFKQYGWKGYIVYFALNTPADLIRIFNTSINVEQEERLIQAAHSIVRKRRVNVGPPLVREGLDYYSKLSMQSSNSSLYQHVRKFAHYHDKFEPNIYVNRSSYTPIMIHDFYNRLYKNNQEFYESKPDELFNFEQIDYQDYLNSPFWYVIRSTVLYRDAYKCQLCGTHAQTVHHHSYEKDVLYGMNLKEMASLCDLCHEKIEFKDGKKVKSLNEKRQRYDILRHQYLSSY